MEGKTTYSMGMKMFMDAIGRNTAIINLDFANDHVPYDVAIDVRELITLEVGSPHP
jgi:GPN-loop GTPase